MFRQRWNRHRSGIRKDELMGNDLSTYINRSFQNTKGFLENKNAFMRLFEFGRNLVDANPLVWPDLIRFYLGSIQSTYLTAPVIFPDILSSKKEKDYKTATILFGDFLEDKEWRRFPLNSNIHISEYYKQNIKMVKLNLCHDIILPWPWNEHRLQRALLTYGLTIPWQEDPTNHKVTALWPLGIATVERGNHSLSAGIIRRTGIISAEFVDMTSWIKEYYTDGEAFYEKSTNEVISKYPSPAWACVWELSRYIITHNLNTQLWGC